MQARGQIFIFFLILLASIAFFMLVDFEFDIWRYILELRTNKLLGLLVVATSVGISTLLFQTVTQNPILTPSILGFDALFMLIQSALILTLGGINFVHLNEYLRFAIEVSIMVSASLFLFKTLLLQGRTDLIRMILIGAIFGVLFKSLSSFINRLIDPNDFLMLQTEMFASFNTINTSILYLTTVITAILAFIIWRWRFVLDIMMLGRNQSINLGVDFDKYSYRILIIIAILISTSTALVGPVNFFGLLVVAMVNKFSATFHHKLRLPLVILLAAIVLILGQAAFENLFGLQGTLSVVIDFLGGLVFLWLLYKQRRIKR